MKQPLNHDTQRALRSIRGAVWRTWAGLFAERFVRAFWPVYSLIFAGAAFGLMGGIDTVAGWARWCVLGFVLAFCVLTFVGLRAFRWPHQRDLIARLDASVTGAPLASLIDVQGTGGDDAASVALWRAHRDQMFTKAKSATAQPANLRLSSHDTYGLRYMAFTGFLVALLFGSGTHIRNLPAILVGGGPTEIAATWEGWMVPPRHTGLPRVYLADVDGGELRVPEQSEITLRLYGDVEALKIEHTLTDVGDSIRVDNSGTLAITGRGGAEWRVFAISDRTPTVRVLGASTTTADGEFRQKFAVTDDYGAVSGMAQFGLNLAAINRKYGFTVAPDLRDDIIVDLPMSVTGGRGDFQETLVEQFEEHPWAGQPVVMQMSVTDAVGQTGAATAVETTMSNRAFYDPVAQAIVELRRDILWARANAPRVAQILRALTHRPDERTAGSDTYLGLRHVIRTLESETPLSPLTQTALAKSLWDIARQIEDGDLADAKEELARAQDRLAEAIRQGASDEEIERLTQELQRAMENYMQQAARDPSGDDAADEGGEATQVTQQDIDDLMERVEDLLKQGRTEDALALLDALREMMENMTVTQGEAGQGEGLQGLADTLRDQQDLSDDAFRQLQDQFNGEGADGRGDLADRQQALRSELDQRRRDLPNTGGEAALDDADGAMDRAEQALRNNDIAGAIDGQAEAIERLREGMRGVAQEQSGPNNGRDRGQAQNGDDPSGRDPLGREQGAVGSVGSNGGLSPRADIYNRARELMENLQSRSQDQSRSEAELEYLERLLQQFD